MERQLSAVARVSSRASNESSQRLREVFTITEKAPTRGLLTVG